MWSKRKEAAMDTQFNGGGCQTLTATIQETSRLLQRGHITEGEAKDRLNIKDCFCDADRKPRRFTIDPTQVVLN